MPTIAINPMLHAINPLDGIFATTTHSNEELLTLAHTNWDNWEPGTGAVNGDVRLINVPPQGFYTSILAITDTNRHMIREHTEARMEGETPVTHKVIDLPKKPAEHAQLIAYKAELLEEDRSSDTEWEVIAVLAWVGNEAPPMDIREMERNASGETGGTDRMYSEEEWEISRSFWSDHAYAILPPKIG